MSKQNKGFTLIELIIVILIISILTTISFVAFQNNMVDSRDATRKADMTNLKVALKSSMKKTWFYPDPAGNLINITNSWTVYVNQWILDSSISIDNLQEIPKDPKNEQFYLYSTTTNKQEFEVWMALENGWNPVAYVDWDYKTVAKNLIPSLLLATSWSWNFEINENVWIWTMNDWSKNRLKFILNWSSQNLPYKATATSFTWLINDAWITIPADTTYHSIDDIIAWQKYMWTWEYDIRSY